MTQVLTGVRMMSSGFKTEYLSNADLPPKGYASSLPDPNGISCL